MKACFKISKRVLNIERKPPHYRCVIRRRRVWLQFASYRADLSESDLSAAQVSEGQLATCKSIEGATMPKEQKYEDWLRDKESHGEDE